MSGKFLSTPFGHLSRRSFIQGAISLSATPVVTSSLLSACQRPGKTNTKGEDTIDEALEILISNGTFRGSTHVPMVAEAIVTLGRNETVISWVDRHKSD